MTQAKEPSAFGYQPPPEFGSGAYKFTRRFQVGDGVRCNHGHVLFKVGVYVGNTGDVWCYQCIKDAQERRSTRKREASKSGPRATESDHPVRLQDFMRLMRMAVRAERETGISLDGVDEKESRSVITELKRARSVLLALQHQLESNQEDCRGN